jgi:hypothetical protein
MSIAMNRVTNSITLLVVFLLSTFSRSAVAIGCPGEDSIAEGMARVRLAVIGKVTAGIPVGLRYLPQEHCDNVVDCRVPKAPQLKSGSVGVELAHEQSWVCVAVAGKRPLDVWTGWLPEQRWQKRETNESSPEQWLGVWQNYGAKIWITATANGALSVRGDAIYDNGSAGGPHFGDFSFVGTPASGALSNSVDLNEEQCSIVLRVTGDFLVAADNARCGGLNVRFDGVYRLRRRSP